MLENKKIIIMGGGTAGWLSALNFLTTSQKENTNSSVVLVSSSSIPTIGVGEGTTPIFMDFLDMCSIDKNIFLKESKGSFKYGIKFKNWNFDNRSYFHLFNSLNHEVVKFYQYCVNHSITDNYEYLQKRLHGKYYQACIENKVDLTFCPKVALHFSAPLIIEFLEKKCKEYSNFSLIDSKINKVNYKEDGSIKSLILEEEKVLEGDFYVNCLGLTSKNILKDEYHDHVDISNIIANNKSCTLQVKNSKNSDIEPYTTSIAEDYGWSWKIPQYEKTGYGYVHSTHFVDDEDRIFEDLMKSNNIDENDIISSNRVNFNTFYNKRHIHKNCLTVGLAAGFIEPLEATSIHLTISSLLHFNQLIYRKENLEETSIKTFNERMTCSWINAIKNVVFHYFNESNKNEYWKYYNSLSSNPLFDTYQEFLIPESDKVFFSQENYFAISLGLRKKNFHIYNFYEGNVEIPEKLKYFFTENEFWNLEHMPSARQILDQLHLTA